MQRWDSYPVGFIMRKEKVIGWLRFKFNGYSATGRTQVWLVEHKDNYALLGVIRWRNSWRQYVHAPFANTEFSRSCHDAINQFIDELMEGRKNAKKES